MPRTSHQGSNAGLVPDKKIPDAIILHHRVGHSIFIVMVDRQHAACLEDFRKTGTVPKNAKPTDWCMTEDVFVGRLGMRASVAELESAFGSNKRPVVLEKILKEGEWKSEDHAGEPAVSQFETDFRSR
mmetsp:Transcript_39910/g.97831  ORF Transcript_39910/g.97831 Transcript_39910/m.97831 type:complete len:128 (-) Transcript_39910:430-813(-)